MYDPSLLDGFDLKLHPTVSRAKSSIVLSRLKATYHLPLAVRA
jgi:hypothetical protein